jgi:GH24 family phage-related lysozyme (muramidase)
MKGGLFFLLFIISNFKDCVAYSNPNTWDQKKGSVIRLATDFIANRESFSATCYKDGVSNDKHKTQRWSLGFGTAQTVTKENWCDSNIKRLRYENKLYRFLPDDVVRKKVVVSVAVAKWKVKEFVIVIYDNLEKRNLVNHLDEIQLVGLVSFIYTIGETAFYKKTSLYQLHLIDKKDIKKSQCIAIRKMFLDWSQVRTKKGFAQSKGAKNRREVEMYMFTHKSCVF